MLKAIKAIGKWALFLVALVFLFRLTLYLLHEAEGYQTRQQQKELSELYRPGDEAAGMEADAPTEESRFSALLAINPDVVGWVSNGDSRLDFPVLQRDNAYYLTHNFYMQQDSHGAVFLDERNSYARPDDNLVLYAHNVANVMFHVLEKYQQREYLQQYPIVSFDTLEQDGDYVIFSVFLASTLPDQGPVFDYHNRLNFATAADKQAFLDEVTSRSLWITPVDVNTDDQLLTLSTCTYEFSEARLVVMARKLRAGETAADFDFSTVTRNPDPVMPQIWEELYG